MEMEHFRHRTAARVVAYIDLVVTCISIFALVALFFLGITATVLGADAASRTPDRDDAQQLTALLILMWIFMAFALICGCINLWAVIMLLKATAQGAEVSKALHRAHIWRNVMVIFLIIGVMQSLLAGEFVAVAFQLIIRGIMIYFVVKFIQEMDAFVRSGGSQLPTYHHVNVKI